MTQLATLLLDSKLVSVLCHLGNYGCGDGGWTPVMKMDGKKVKLLRIFPLSLRGRRLKGKGKGFSGARETRGRRARREGRKHLAIIGRG